jgi:Flp pilus assembly pilin Flp
MERIRRFLLDESGSSEAVSSVILIAFAGLLLTAALAYYYGAFSTFFQGAGTKISSWAFGDIAVGS